MKAKYIGFLAVGLVVISIFQISRMKARVVVCDVGQGDGILVLRGSFQMVVDGGSSGDKIMACLGEYLPFWDRDIEVVVMTNTDRDHSGGLGDVIRAYSVERFVTGDGLKGTATFRELVEKVRGNRVRIEVVEAGDSIRVGEEVFIEVLWPDEVDETVVAGAFADEGGDQILGEWDGEDINERSVVLMVTIEGYSVLLMGDAGFQTEKSLIEYGLARDVDVLKVGHHGSKYSTSEEFLRIVDPEYAVISVGKNNYGHPTEEVIGRISGVGARLYRTDRDGNVVLDF